MPKFNWSEQVRGLEYYTQFASYKQFQAKSHRLNEIELISM